MCVSAMGVYRGCVSPKNLCAMKVKACECTDERRCENVKVRACGCESELP